MIQYIVDGIIVGATLALGAIGLTLTYNILRFANFAHGESLPSALFRAVLRLLHQRGTIGRSLSAGVSRGGGDRDRAHRAARARRRSPSVPAAAPQRHHRDVVIASFGRR